MIELSFSINFKNISIGLREECTIEVYKMRPLSIMLQKEMLSRQ